MQVSLCYSLCDADSAFALIDERSPQIPSEGTILSAVVGQEHKLRLICSTDTDYTNSRSFQKQDLVQNLLRIVNW